MQSEEKSLNRRGWVQDVVKLSGFGVIANSAMPVWADSSENGSESPNAVVSPQTTTETATPAVDTVAKVETATTETATPARVEFAEGFPSDATLPYKGNELPLKKFRAKATLVVNLKTDDPEGTRQLPPLAYLTTKYASKGLRVLAFPTDQGWYEPEVSDIVRLRALQTFGFGAFPNAVVFDKVDLLGQTAHPLYKYLMTELRNPNGRAAVSLNFEKFLLDETGRPVRRYPRKYDAYQIEKDVAALLAGEPLPEETADFKTAWIDAARESIKSEYTFRVGYNLYTQNSASKDWSGIANDGFR